jgi:hydroxypyruvate isomerase
MVEHSLAYEVNCSILFTELPLLERPAAAKEAGFDAVEFWWPFAVAVPADGEVEAFVRAVGDAGVRLVGLNFFAGDMPGGDRGLVSWPARSGEFRDNVDVALGVGDRLGCRAFNALYGNRQDGVAAQAQDELGAENLALAARAARRIGGTVLVEPVTGAPRYPLRTAADAWGVIDRAGEENIRLLFDVYHLAVNGDDVEKATDTAAGRAVDGAAGRAVDGAAGRAVDGAAGRAVDGAAGRAVDGAAARIGHVQIADAPGRHEPGTGKLPIDSYLDRIAATGYDGWVGLEYQPSGASADSFDWLPRGRRSSR